MNGFCLECDCNITYNIYLHATAGHMGPTRLHMTICKFATVQFHMTPFIWQTRYPTCHLLYQQSCHSMKCKSINFLNSPREELSITNECRLFQTSMTLLVKKDCLKLVLVYFFTNLHLCPLVGLHLCHLCHLVITRARGTCSVWCRK